MDLRWLGCWVGLCGACALAQTPSQVGAGSTTAVQAAFVDAYQRNGFSNLVGAPLGNVTAFGTGGLIQTFPGAINSSLTLALIKPDATATFNVVQMQAAIYYFYGFVTVDVAGLPTADTTNCPILLSASLAGNSCQWQPFANNYAIFAYSQSLSGADEVFSSQVALGDPYFTLWNKLGGVTGLGPATAQLRQYNSPFGSGATVQNFDQGVIYKMNAGPASGQLLTVKEPVYDVYAAKGAEQGALGLPLAGETLLANGMRQQAFERGAVAYNPTTGVAMLQPPIASLAITPGNSIQMSPGGTAAAQAAIYAIGGAALTGLPVVWNTSDAKVVQIQGGGSAVTLMGTGFGTAAVTVSAEGQTSAPLTVLVTASFCCLIGQGAPNNSIQQAFQDAVARNGLNVQLPAASGVTRVGNGYVQQLASAGTSSVPYLVAVPDSTSAGSVVAGPILPPYLLLGGPGGALGYPLSDATPGGRQTFQNGTLAGTPVQLVSGAILSKWQTLGYETGVAGPPTSSASAFVTFAGTTGNMQSFQNGPILTTAAGPLAGQAFFVTGLTLAAYSAAGGPGGNLGAPTGDEQPVNGQRRQNFEGGYISYTPGDAKAVEHDTPRQPLITATPGVVRAGSSVHLVIGGFNSGATLRVSQTGQADFLVTTPGGSYTWDAWLPANAPAGQVTVKASDTNGSAAAQGSYNVYAASANLLTISIVSGDQQTGAPGAQLTQPLVVLVQDQDGNPVSGQAVAFAASPGAQVVPASVTTGPGGRASAMLRLPLAAGISLATAQAGSKIVTFSAKSAAFSLTNFPALTQAVNGTLGSGAGTIQNTGALLTAAASILLYHQSRGELPQPNGPAGVISLNQFLTSFCAADSKGNQICDGYISLGQGAGLTVNLWRLGAFVSNDLTVQIEPVSSAAVNDLVAEGSPVLLALSLGGLGSHFAVATGIASDGSLLIADPNPVFAQTNLNGYLNGFSAAGQSVQGTLTGVVRLLPQAPASPGFMVAANTPIALSSTAGSCGQTLQFPSIAGVPGAMTTSPPGMLYFGACDGSAGLYELDTAGVSASNLAFTDLSPKGSRTIVSGAGPASSEIVVSGQQWTVAPLASLIAGNVLNAASFTTAIAPGGLISVFGAGLAGSGPATVQINGQPALLIAATPFQVNAQVPYGVSPGAAQLVVTTGNGSAQVPVAISSLAPAIFSITAAQAAIANQDNSLNAPSNPARRGSVIVVYATGFGAVSTTGVALTPVSAVIGGVEIQAAYAGISPGTAGLNQVNVMLPSAIPPGLSLPLYLKQNGAVSNTVTVAIQ